MSQVLGPSGVTGEREHAFGECTWPEAFFACDDVNVLIPKTPMSKWVQLFIATIIKHGRRRFTYGYKWTLARMKTTTVRLPVTGSGDPDWAYMENFMRGLPYSAAVDN